MANKKLVLTIILATLLPISLGLGIKLFKPAKATALLSPLAETHASPLPKATNYSVDYYLSLAGSFLEKATRLANDNPSQTEEDKQIILKTINEALMAANEAISYYPQNPQTYLTRAQIYQKIKHLIPEAEGQEKQDLEMAKQLINKTNQNITNNNKDSHPINFIPTQKASIANNIVIAEPGPTKKAVEVSPDEVNTNALSGSSILFSGEKEVIIPCLNLKEKDLIYVSPDNNTDNQTLYVKARENGAWFKVALNKPINKDIEFKWWVIPNEDKGNL